MKKLLSLFCAGAAFLLSAEAPSAQNNYKIPESWKPKKVVGRDFWMIGPEVVLRGNEMTPNEWNCITTGNAFFPLKDASAGIRKLSAMPAFYDTAKLFYCRHDYAVKNPDGTYSFLLPKLDPSLKKYPVILHGTSAVRVSVIGKGYNPERRKNRKTTVYNLKRVTEYVDKAFVAKFDNRNLDAYCKENPNFVGILGFTEWFNEASAYLFNNRLGAIIKWKMLTPAQVQKVRKDFKLHDKSYAGLRYRAKKFFDRNAEVFGGADRIIIFDGSSCVGHLAAYYGAGVIGCETSRIWRHWENQMICERGAARQFGKPWQWFIASFVNNFTRDGKRSGGDYSGIFRPLTGVSHNLIDRLFYYAYLSGTNFIQRENIYNKLFTSWKTWELSPEGENYVKFHNFTKANPDRGSAYTPVALLKPADCIDKREAIITENTPGAAMMNAFKVAIYRLYPDQYMISRIPDFKYKPVHDTDTPFLRAGFEMGLSNTAPYGDIFDAITPDFPDKSTFKKIIPTYKVAVLLGSYPNQPEMEKILVDYVKNGGTLVLNTQQITKGFPSTFTGVKLTGKCRKIKNYTFDSVTLAGAKVVKKTKEGVILFTRHNYGKGSVIVTTPRYMIPVSKDWRAQAAAAGSGKLKYPYVEQLLSLICPEVTPVKVDGDVKFGLNKNSTGWWLYIFNNKGVMKFHGEKEYLDKNRTAKVKIDFKKLKIRSIRELRSGKAYTAKNNKMELQIGPGDFKIFELK